MSEQSSHDVADTEREMREHEREAAERESSEQTPGEQNAADDATKPAPPGDVPSTTGQP
jgi:hypothetical protein